MLYKQERYQYVNVRIQYVTGPNVKIEVQKEMSEVYGAEHLLRMLVSLPKMVASAGMDPESIGLVKAYVDELLGYMERERETIFQEEYEPMTVQYNAVNRS